MDLDQDVSGDVKNAIAALDVEHQDANPVLTGADAGADAGVGADAGAGADAGGTRAPCLTRHAATRASIRN